MVQDFTYERTNFTGTSLSRTSPDPDVAYTLGIDYFPMDFSGGGNVTAPVTAVDVNLVGDHASTSGCEAADFAGFPAGNIALIQRGSCDFSVKAANALAAGAAGVIIFNQGNVVPGDDRLGLFGGTLGSIISEDLPVVSAPYALGAEWATTPGLELSLNVQITVDEVATQNLLGRHRERSGRPYGRRRRTPRLGLRGPRHQRQRVRHGHDPRDGRCRWPSSASSPRTACGSPSGAARRTA